VTGDSPGIGPNRTRRRRGCDVGVCSGLASDGTGWGSRERGATVPYEFGGACRAGICRAHWTRTVNSWSVAGGIV